MFDVAIVGYGPVGKLLAILLAQRGHKVAAIDRFASVYALPRAVHFDDETGRLLDQAGVGDAVRKICITRNAPAEFLSGSGDVLLRLQAEAPPNAGWPARNFFHQPELEQILADRAASLPGLSFFGGYEAGRPVQDDAGVTLSLRKLDPADGADEGADEGERVIRAKYLVGCDGANSLVRESIGAPVEDLGCTHDWLVVDFRRDGSQAWPQAGRQYCDPARPTTYVPLGPHAFRMEFMLKAGEGRDDFGTAAAVLAMVARAGLPTQGIEIVRQAIYTFRALWLTRWQSGRIFIAGDAAHLTPPFLGQGLCSGMRDAATLAWKIDLVLAGHAHADVLETYGREREPHVATLIRCAMDYGAVICVTDPEQASKRDSQMLVDGVKTLPAVPRPRLGPGIALADDPHAGYLLPQGRVEHDGAIQSVDQIQRGGFLLLGADADPLANLSEQSRRFLRGIGTQALNVTSSRDVDGVFGPWLARQERRFALVRPDYYVFGTAAHAADVEPMVAALRRQLAASAAASDAPAVARAAAF